MEVVLKFAQFLITACGTEVALDLLEEQVISEVGVMTWVSRQKQEMVESNSKIIICVPEAPKQSGKLSWVGLSLLSSYGVTTGSLLGTFSLQP